MAEVTKLELYDKAVPTNHAVFDFRGGLDHAENCPLQHGNCAPDSGPGCPHFMGHHFKGDAAYVGQRAPVCCEVLLRHKLLTRPAKENDHG